MVVQRRICVRVLAVVFALAVIGTLALIVTHRPGSAYRQVAVRASVAKSTAIPAWMATCLTNQHISGSPVAPGDVGAMVPAATAVATATADHPGLSTAGLLTVPVHVSGESDAAGSAQIPAVDALKEKPVWAIAFTGLHIPYGGQYVQGQTTQPTPYMTSWVELVDGSSSTVVLGVGCN